MKAVGINKGDLMHITYEHPLFGTVTTTGKIIHIENGQSLVEFQGIRTILTDAKLDSFTEVIVQPAPSIFSVFKG